MVDILHQAVVMDHASIAQRMLQARKHVGMSQMQVAHAIMSSQTAIGLRERGEYLPKLDTLGHYAQRLNISPVWLICGVGDIADHYEIGQQAEPDPTHYSRIVSVNTPDVAKRVSFARDHAGISQRQLAEELGLHRNSVMGWEIQRCMPTPDKFPAIAWALNCNALWLATGVSVP